MVANIVAILDVVRYPLLVIDTVFGAKINNLTKAPINDLSNVAIEGYNNALKLSDYYIEHALYEKIGVTTDNLGEVLELSTSCMSPVSVLAALGFIYYTSYALCDYFN